MGSKQAQRNKISKRKVGSLEETVASSEDADQAMRGFGNIVEAWTNGIL